jgi:hypothetical protein
MTPAAANTITHKSILDRSTFFSSYQSVGFSFASQLGSTAFGSGAFTSLGEAMRGRTDRRRPDIAARTAALSSSEIWAISAAAPPFLGDNAAVVPVWLAVALRCAQGLAPFLLLLAPSGADLAAPRLSSAGCRICRGSAPAALCAAPSGNQLLQFGDLVGFGCDRRRGSLVPVRACRISRPSP